MDKIDRFIKKYGKELLEAIKSETADMEYDIGETNDEYIAYTLGYFVGKFAIWAENKDPRFNTIMEDSKYIIKGIQEVI